MAKIKSKVSKSAAVTAIRGKYEKLRGKLGQAEGTATLADIAVECFLIRILDVWI